jgi:hypothetical protein
VNRRLGLVAAGAVVAALVMVVAGRWEGRREARLENARIQETMKIIGSDLSRHLTAYRPTPSFTCLVYGRSDRPFEYEICLDPQGRVIEALDRSLGLRIGSLRYEPSLATHRIEPQRALMALRARAPKSFPPSLRVLPTGPDLGPVVLPTRGA